METLIPPEIVWPFVLSAAASLGLIVAVFLIRLHYQVKADHMHQTYELHFPADVNMASVYGALRALSGLDKPRFLHPIYTVSFEHYADADGERYFLHLPGHMNERIDTWLEKHLDVVVDTIPRDEDPVRTTFWYAAVELTMTGGSLHIVDPVIDSGTVGVRFENMAAGERLVSQWIVYPAKKLRPTPETKEKEATNTFNAKARIGAVGEKPDVMIRDVLAGYKSIEHEGAYFSRRVMPGVGGRINRRAGTMDFPIYINETELATVCGWPLGGSTVVRARRLPPTTAHDAEGLILGESNSPRARGRKIAIPVEGAFTHMHVMGGTGVGKSNFLLTTGLQAMDQGMAVIVIEPAGDLAYDFLDRIPAHRVDDVILLDPTDTDWPIGINVMAGGDPERITGHIVGMFKSLAPDSWGHRLERILSNAVYTVALNQGTFYDLRPILTNKHFRTEQLKKISRQRHPYVFEEWGYVDSAPDMAIDSAVNKINAFLGYETVRNIVAQQQGLDFDAILRDHKILLAPLPAARMGLVQAQAIGQLITELVCDAAMRQLPGERQPSMVIEDEFHNFSAYAMSKSDRFSEARKYRQSYVIANQYVKQLEDSVMETIKMNVQNQVIFRLAPEDAKRVAAVYPPLKAEELAALPRYGVAARLTGSSEGYTPTVTFRTFAAPPKTGHRQQIVANSRRRYAKPISEVRAEIAAKHKGPEARRKPIIGSLENDE